MSTKMTDTDWANALEVLAACHGAAAKPRTTDCFWKRCTFSRWRMCAGVHCRNASAIGTRCGGEFDRLSKAGVFEAFFDTLAEMSASAHLIQMFDSTIVRAHVSAAGAKGAARPGARPLAWRVHDENPRQSGQFRRHHRVDLTGGQVADTTRFETLLNIGPDITPRAALGDKGYSSKANRAAARTRGIAPVIPHKANEKNAPAFFAKTLYKARARIEQGFGRLKRFKRVALRCEKTAQNFRSIVSFAAGLCLIKFVHTA